MSWQAAATGAWQSGGGRCILAPMTPAMEALREDLGTDFELVRPLGQGAFAEVFLARERALERPVAVKVLRRSLSADETARKRFLREARLAAKIRHPSVVAVHRVGELGDGRPYLVMEYIDGRTYADIVAAGGQLGEDEVREVLTEVCGALDAAHALGIIHRDVRPGNIMRTRDGGRVVLADFGIAGVLETGGEAATRITGAGQILGQVGYAPPEQLSGESIQPGSDMYSLAVTAYELLTGSGPFPQATRMADQIRAHLTEEPVRLRALRPDVGTDLEDLLLRCLQKRPEQRPSATLMRSRLAGGAALEPQGAMASFLSELKRRGVYKVGAAYGAFMMIVLSLVDSALPALPLPLPPWTATAVVTATLAGLPVALVLGWIFDLSAGRIERTRALSSEKPRGLPVLQWAALLIILALAGLVAWLVRR